MKKISTFSTKVISTGFAAKDILGTVLHPVIAMRNFIKKNLIKTIVMVIKKAIKLTTKNKIGSESNLFVRQLNALGDNNADMSGLTKSIQVKMTLDSILEQADETEVNKLFNMLDISNITNKMARSKNYLRNNFYDYIVENDFENMKTIILRVNDVLKIPTQIVGCEFVSCKFSVENHAPLNRDFLLVFNVDFAVKSS